ncbi:MAG: hypothetical protein ACTSYI_15020, partial [Promethearchaeota archaeon]
TFIILRIIATSDNSVCISMINSHLARLPHFLQEFIKFPIQHRGIMDEIVKMLQQHWITMRTLQSPNASHPVKYFKITEAGQEFFEMGRGHFCNLFCSESLSSNHANIQSNINSNPAKDLTHDDIMEATQTATFILPEILGKELEELTKDERAKMEKISEKLVTRIINSLGFTVSAE